MHYTNIFTRHISALAGALLTVLATISPRAADWPQWRGPHFNGGTDEKNLPSKWTKDSALWTVDMPGASAATPVILGDKVFVSSADDVNKTLQAMCLDRKTGKIIWNNKIGEGNIARDDKSNYAGPSPVAGPDLVYFFYGNGDLVAFDHAGKQAWARSITKDYGDFAFQWTFSASPLLYNNRLYIQVLQRDTPVHGKGKKDGESFILALDPKTGKQLWRHVRPAPAVQESLESYSTPMPYEHNGLKQILVTGGDCITGHNPDTGDELWRWGTWNPQKIGHWRLVPSPVAGAGVALACAPKGDPIYALPTDKSGSLDNAAILWTTRETREITTDVPTPLFYDGDFFILSDIKRNLTRVDPKTGAVKWTVETPGRKKYEASPTGADGKIYLINFAGDVTVVDAAKGTILNTIPMGEPGDDMIRSTITAAHGQLFIRTNKKLFSIAQK